MTDRPATSDNPHVRSPEMPARLLNNSARMKRDIKSPSHPSENIALVDKPNNPPPLANPEIDDEADDLDDDREVVSKPFPGVDDGFFNTLDNNKPKEEENPDVETVPIMPKNDLPPYDENERPVYGDEIPVIISRAGEPDGGSDADDMDGTKRPLSPNNYPKRFPYAPNFGPDVEFGVGTFTDLESIPDVNVYQHKKTLAQGMMDLALFSANANQLRYVLESSRRHPYYYPSVVMIAISLIFQVAVGVGLIWNATYNVKDKKEICIANKINNFTIIGIFLVTVVNVFISAFGVANPASTTT